MRIELQRRSDHSKLFSILSPFIALGLTLIAGAIMFSALGLNPAKAMYSFFIEPLTEVWSVHELVIKATPLVLIAVGLSICFLSGNWNIGAEGQLVMGAIAGSFLPIVFSRAGRLVGITCDDDDGDGRRRCMGLYSSRA